MTALSIRRGGRPAASADRYLPLAALAALAWAALMVQQRYGILHVQTHLPGRAVLATPFAALAILIFAPPEYRSLRIFALVVGTVAFALLMAPVIDSKPSVAIIAPVVVLVVAAMLRWPALGLSLIVVITGSFGAMTAFLSFHYNKVLTAVLVGLWIAAILRALSGQRRERMRFPLSVALFTVYLGITLIQGETATNHAQAVATLEHDDWYMAALLLIGFGAWSRSTLRILARTIVVGAVLVGGYAALRWSIGPAQVERALALTSTFNLVNGKLKLIGSFPNGADLALWTSLAIPFCAAYALAARDRWRWIAATGAVLCAIGVVGSQVRAGTAAATVALLVVLVLFQASRGFRGLHLGTTAAAIAVVAIAGIGAFAYTGGSISSSHSFVSLFNSNDQSRVGHSYKWSQALRDLHGHPFGFGVGSAATGYAGGSVPPSPYVNNIAAQSVDSGYLKIGLEQGLTVMGIFAAALLTLLIGLGAGAVRARDPDSAGLLIGAAGTLTVLVVLFGAGAFMEGLPALLGWIIVGMGVSQLAKIRAPARAPESAVAQARAVQRPISTAPALTR